MKRNRDNLGQGLVEWALFLPLFLFLFMGMVEFGIIMSKQHVLSQVSKEMTRSATLGKTSDELQELSIKVSNALLKANVATIEHYSTTSIITVSDIDGDQVTIQFTPALPNRTAGNEIHVEVFQMYEPFTPFFNFAAFELKGENYSIIE